MMEVIIDDREGSKELIKYPPLDTLGRLDTLDYGDVCFTGRGPDGPVLVGAELKSINDLISSMASNRLQGYQVPGMMAYDVPWLLFYGIYRPHPKSGVLQVLRHHGFWTNCKLGRRDITYKYVMKALMTIVEAGVRVHHCSSLREAASWIGWLADWWSEPWEDHSSLKVIPTTVGGPSLFLKIDEKTKQRTKFALQFPSLGPTRALAAAKHFPTIRRMANATVEEWAEVPGIGKMTAADIIRAVT